MTNFTVSATSGFAAPNGQPWTMRGLNAGVQDALQGFANVLTDYPGLTAIRLNVVPGSDSAASIDQVVQEYTAKGIVVEIEDHSGNGDNVAWYQQMATAYKGNPLVFLETPNEPSTAAATTAQYQIGIINAIRAAGFTGLIGVQPNGGWDFANVSTVTAAVGTAGLFVTPHIYYNGTDPNGAAQYVQGDVQTAKGLGLFASIDEFGNAIDGYTLDPQGNTVITAVVAANEAGQAGAVFWAMDNDNHPDGTDSAFLNPNGTQLTPVGKNLQPWLSQPTTPTGGGTTPPVTPPVPPAPVTTGTRSDTLVLGISEDAYQGDAQFTVSVDGKQLGGTFTTTALHSSGVSQSFTFKGDWTPGAHAVVVNFLNDAWGGSAATDRNLYVNGITYDGTVTGQSAVLGVTGPQNFSVTDSTAIPVAPPVTFPTGIPAVDPTTSPAPPTGSATAPPPGAPENYSIACFDASTNQPLNPDCHDYSGPVPDLQYEYIIITSDNLNIATPTPNWFIHSGGGDDAIAVSSGTNVLDGGTGSNFLTGGSGADTFFVDDRGAQADIWSTLNNFQAGDAATIWGVTPQDFGLTWANGQGAADFTGLTLHVTAPGRPIASLTLAGYSQADLSSGRVSVQFGADPASGSAYMYVHGNS